MTQPPDPFDDAIARMDNARRASHEAFLDADAALTVRRNATAARGSLSQQITELHEALQRLEALVLEQGQLIRELRNGHRS